MKTRLSSVGRYARLITWRAGANPEAATNQQQWRMERVTSWFDSKPSLRRWSVGRYTLSTCSLLFFAVACGLWPVASHAQDPEGKSPDLKPTDVQQLKLENLQLKAQLALQTFNQAQAAYNQSVVALFAGCDEVKKENNWDKGVTCDPNTLKFSPPSPVKSGPQPPSAAPPEGKSKDEATGHRSQDTGKP